MKEHLPVIHIRAQTNHHAVFLIVMGIALFITVLIIALWYWRQYQLIMVFGYLTTFVITLTGIVKRLEPRFSFSLTPDLLRYHHRYGQWQLGWQQIQRIATVKETVGIETLELAYIGIKLKDIETNKVVFNTSISRSSSYTTQDEPFATEAARTKALESITSSLSGDIIQRAALWFRGYTNNEDNK